MLRNHFFPAIFLLNFFSCIYGNLGEDSFHIRHFNGSCVQADASQTSVVLTSLCKDKFRWKGGIKLVHIPTRKCLALASVGSMVSLTRDCDGTDTLFQYEPRSHSIKHLVTGRCIKPEKGLASDQIGSTAVCRTESSAFWLVPQAMYTIRNSENHCAVYDSSKDRLNLFNRYVCDRFFFENGTLLKHFETEKCVIPVAGILKLTTACTAEDSAFDWNAATNIVHRSSGKCATTYKKDGSSYLTLSTTCTSGTEFTFQFFDDRNIIQARLTSESCEDLTPGTACSEAKGHIVINGYQHSLDSEGINVVILDYRSGLFEHKSAFNLYNSVSQQNKLAEFLNSLSNGKILFMSVKDSVVINSNLASALQKHGVSATFATTSVYLRCSMVTIAYTSKTRKSWEKSVHQLNCKGATLVNQNINLFHDLKGINDCSQEMGVRTGKISNSKFAAASALKDSYKAYHARLHYNGFGWCSRSTSLSWSDYVQVDVGAKKLLSGIAIQENGKVHRYSVTKFKIKFSMDGKDWQYHVDESQSHVVFEGNRKDAGDTRLNWFPRRLTRFIRIIPMARAHNTVHCIRMELFGCTPTGPLFRESIPSPASKSIKDSSTGEFSFIGIAPLSKKIRIGISTAASNTTLAHDIPQSNYDRINETVISDNGTVQSVAKINDNKIDIASNYLYASTTDFQLREFGFYNLAIGFKKMIVDSGLKSGAKVWNMYSYETEDELLIICMPMTIIRSHADTSLLNMEIKTTNNETTNEVVLSLTITHRDDKTNAYNLSLSLMYDVKTFKLDNISNSKKNNFSVSPSRNTSKQGIFQMQTDRLGILNNHFIKIYFKAILPNQSFKIKKCKEAIMVDFTYATNLAKFDGKLTKNMGKLIPYECKMPFKPQDLVPASRRIPVPGISILFDDVNSDLYICTTIVKFRHQNRPFCYLQKKGSLSWHSIPQIASVVGIDTASKTLFGLDSKGNGYAKSESNMQAFAQVDDVEWTSIQNRPLVRKSKTTDSVCSLPNISSSAWLFASSGNEEYAATRSGLTKKIYGKWKAVLAFNSTLNCN